jgi:signal transduction histidine kinase
MSRSDRNPAKASATPVRAVHGLADILRLEREVMRLKTALAEQACRAVAEREAEREAIARELHDKFGQYLTVVALELNTIGRQSPLPQGLADRVAKLEGLTSQAERDMANMAWQMRPVAPGGLDLETSCRQLAEEWSERAALAFDLHLSLGSRKLPPSVAATLYRVLQEALINVVKHANAGRIGIILRAVPHMVMLVVEDDGGGFDHDDMADTSLSLGIRGIRERLALVGGSLEIESSPGQGTTLLVNVPL